MVGVLIRLKFRVLRHSLRGNQGWFTGVGALFGLLAATVTIVVSTVDFDEPGIGVDVLAGLYLLWAVGWLFGPVFTGGGDETLRPEHFALLPLTPRQLATGLLGAAFVGVPAVVTFLAFCGLVLFADGAGVVVALVAVPLQLAFVVLLSRVVMAGLGAALRSRRGKDLGVLLAALVGLSGFVAQALFNNFGQVLLDGGSATLSAVLRWAPSGWAVVAVDAAGTGNWLLALVALAGLAAVCAVLLAVWGVLLVRRTTRVAANQGPRETGTRGGLAQRLPATPVGAVAAKELRLWLRDARRRVSLLTMVIVGTMISVIPAVTEGDTDSLPFAPVAVTVFACLLAGNLYGMDGSALWHTLVTPGAAAADVRGRQLAWLLVVGPVALVLTAVLPGISDPSSYPWVLALVPVVLGGGAGLIMLLSVFAGYPLPDQKANPFAAGGNPGLVRTAQQVGISLLLGVVSAPVVLLLIFGGDNPVLRWSALPLGIAIGAVLFWWWGRIAYRRLAARGPEILATVGKKI